MNVIEFVVTIVLALVPAIAIVLAAVAAVQTAKDGQARARAARPMIRLGGSSAEAASTKIQAASDWHSEFYGYKPARANDLRFWMDLYDSELEAERKKVAHQAASLSATTDRMRALIDNSRSPMPEPNPVTHSGLRNDLELDYRIEEVI